MAKTNDQQSDKQPSDTEPLDKQQAEEHAVRMYEAWLRDGEDGIRRRLRELKEAQKQTGKTKR